MDKKSDSKCEWCKSGQNLIRSTCLSTQPQKLRTGKIMGSKGILRHHSNGGHFKLLDYTQDHCARNTAALVRGKIMERGK